MVKSWIGDAPRADLQRAWLAVKRLQLPAVELTVGCERRGAVLGDLQDRIKLSIGQASSHNLEDIEQAGGAGNVPHAVVDEKAVGRSPASTSHDVCHEQGLVPLPACKSCAVLTKNIDVRKELHQAHRPQMWHDARVSEADGDDEQLAPSVGEPAQRSGQAVESPRAAKIQHDLVAGHALENVGPVRNGRLGKPSEPDGCGDGRIEIEENAALGQGRRRVHPAKPVRMGTEIQRRYLRRRRDDRDRDRLRGLRLRFAWVAWLARQAWAALR